MVGIYKITNPKGKIYIGQSSNIGERIYSYKSANCKQQTKLFHSIVKYGWGNHILEVLEECSIELLNEREKYYIKLFCSFNSKNGLNLQSGGNDGKYSDISKNKISKSKKGKLLSDEHKRKIGEKSKGRKPFEGKKHSEQTKKKLSEYVKANSLTRGKKINPETIAKRTETRKLNFLKKHSLGGV